MKIRTGAIEGHQWKHIISLKHLFHWFLFQPAITMQPNESFTFPYATSLPSNGCRWISKSWRTQVLVSVQYNESINVMCVFFFSFCFGVLMSNDLAARKKEFVRRTPLTSLMKNVLYNHIQGLKWARTIWKGILAPSVIEQLNPIGRLMQTAVKWVSFSYTAPEVASSRQHEYGAMKQHPLYTCDASFFPPHHCDAIVQMSFAVLRHLASATEGKWVQMKRSFIWMPGHFKCNFSSSSRNVLKLFLCSLSPDS